MKNNKLNIPVTKTKLEIPIEFEKKIHSLIDDLSKKNKVLSNAIALKPVSLIKKKAAQPLYKVNVHNNTTPKFNSWNNTRHDPDTKSIHVWHSDNFKDNDLHDSLLRAALNNILNLVHNGPNSLKTQITEVTSNSPLKSNEIRERLKGLYGIKNSRIKKIHNALKNLQSAAYGESHDKRTQKKLDSYKKQHAAGMHSQGVNGIIIKHFKHVLNVGQHTPIEVLGKKLARLTKTPKTTAAFTEFYKTLKNHLGKI